MYKFILVVSLAACPLLWRFGANFVQDHENEQSLRELGAASQTTTLAMQSTRECCNAAIAVVEFSESVYNLCMRSRS